MNKELAQIAILQELDKKAQDQGPEKSLIKIYYIDDLYLKHRDIFYSVSSLDEVALVMNTINIFSQGRYEIVDISRSIDDRSVISTASFDPSGNVFQTNMYWEFVYKQKANLTYRDLEKNGMVTLWLSASELYTEMGGEKCSFSVSSKGVKRRILEWFSENPDFINSKDLAEKINAEQRTIQTEIAKLREKANSAFSMQENNFIESNNTEGYRLKPNIKIREVR